jgi:hypothetical protein
MPLTSGSTDITPSGAGTVCAATAARALLERLAVETEQRLYQADQLGMRYGETTITDYNLLELRLANLPNIRVFHVPPIREREFGYDWEWWIRIGSLPWTVLFLQAKKLNPKNGRYDSLGHKVPGTKQRQIDLLLQHATNFGGIPLYSLYNGPRPSVGAWNCASHRDDQQFGCSIVPLHIVRSFISAGRRRASRDGRKRTDFEHLHENDRALPWRCLVCTSRFEGQPWLGALTDPNIEVRGYAELPSYVQQAINADREYVRIQEYPSSAVMAPRHVAVISLEPPITVTPAQLPAPEGDELSSLLELSEMITKKNRAKVLA